MAYKTEILHNVLVTTNTHLQAEQRHYVLTHSESHTMLQYPPRICLVYHTTNHLFLATMETKTLSTHSKTSINQPRRPHAKTKKNDPINWTQYLYYRRKPLLATSIQFASATHSARQQQTWHWAGTRL